jgi:integrase/recombinase XerC
VWLSLDPTVVRVLQAWLAKRGTLPGPLFVQVGKGGRLLDGCRLSGDGVHHIVTTIGARLGVKLWPHGLRHAGITAALDATHGDVRAVREFSGHASIETVLRYDDNRRDLGGKVAGKVMQQVAGLFAEV